jgi:hypothetical protein
LGHGARQRCRPESGELVAWGGGESGLGRRRVHVESDLGVEARRISSLRGAPRWHASDGKEPPAAGQRSGGGRRLGGRGAAVSSGRGRGCEGGLGGRSERPVRTAALSGQGIEWWPSLRRHLELWLGDGLAQGGRRRTSNTVAGSLGKEQRRLLIGVGCSGGRGEWRGEQGQGGS